MKIYIKAGLNEFLKDENIGPDSEIYSDIPVPEGWKSWNLEETAKYFNLYLKKPTGNWSLITKETSHKGMYIGIFRDVNEYGDKGSFFVTVHPGYHLCSYPNFKDALKFANNLSDEFIWKKFSYAMGGNNSTDEGENEDYNEDKFGFIVKSKNGLDPEDLQTIVRDALSGCHIIGFDVEEDDYDETKAHVGFYVEWYDDRSSTTIERLIKKAIRESGFIISKR